MRASGTLQEALRLIIPPDQLIPSHPAPALTTLQTPTHSLFPLSKELQGWYIAVRTVMMSKQILNADATGVFGFHILFRWSCWCSCIYAQHQQKLWRCSEESLRDSIAAPHSAPWGAESSRPLTAALASPSHSLKLNFAWSLPVHARNIKEDFRAAEGTPDTDGI